MKLEELPVGTRFRTNYVGKVGEVVHQGPSGTRVKWDGANSRKQVKDRHGDVVAEFDAPAKPVLISGGTEVTQL